MTSDNNIWGTLGVAGMGAALGVAGTVLTALINRQHPMAALVDARIRLLIEGYERRIDQLESEIGKLEQKVDALTKDLEKSRARHGLGYY
ncbi:MAG: hypothetical protein L0Y60_13135 [Beijerinckiaceae bacterium]|nr:hypothetical protein [Beijerinckiaceae bacterium]